MQLSEIFAQIKAAHAVGRPDALVRKAGGYTEASGLTNYDLQKPALALYPFVAAQRPLGTMLARVRGNGDVATRWKAITAINTTNVPVGVSEGERNAQISQSLTTKLAEYQGIGLENSVTFEAGYAAEGFDDAYARAVQNVLRAAMLAEEPMLLAGNGSLALGTTPTPTATGSTTGGALSNGTYKVGCVALTLAGFQRAAVSASGVVQQISRTNQDGSVSTIPGGVAQPSAQSGDVLLSAGTSAQRISANVTVVRGAVAYAWYLGTSGGTLYLQQITTINSVNFNTALVTSTQTFGSLAATDFSAQSGFSFNGMLTQGAWDSTSGAYYAALDTGTDGTGTKLTSDGAGGITQIETALKWWWDNFFISPDTIFASARHILDITAIIVANGGAPLMRQVMQASGNGAIIGGQPVVEQYFNKLTGTYVKLVIHPSLPDGTIAFRSSTNPYGYSGIGNVDEVHYRQDWYQLEWPLRTRRREYGIYADETYVCYAPFMTGAIVNVATGV